MTKAQILAEKFFPSVGEADLSDLVGEQQGGRVLDIPPTVTKGEIDQVLLGLPSNKTPGPDGIPNEVLTALAHVLTPHMAQAVGSCLARGALPVSYRESTTVVIRKEGKRDFSLPSSYRPIALENSLAKVIEKLVADRIAKAAEEHSLLPWNQMGARKQRSTYTALQLLQTSVQTAWSARPGCIVSMLSLDLAGAFDNVSHDRLLAILQAKGFSDRIVQIVRGFLQGRRTQIALPTYTGPWIETNVGIPQGSPLSPILFLFFISELLDDLSRADEGVLAFGFVDDTSLVAWGDTASDNCLRLGQVHDRCIAWAKRHGARFSPDKYKLIHFTRQRRRTDDLASSIRAGDHPVKPEAEIRVLGVWVDSKLQWKEHVKRAASKGAAAYEAMSRITASTWGPSMKRSRLIYAATVRPVLLYGAATWAVRDNGEPAAESLIRPLKQVQNKCIRRVAGAYKRTPIAAVEREAEIPPLDLHADVVALRHAARTQQHPVTREIAHAADQIWASLLAAPARLVARDGHGLPCPWTGMDGLDMDCVRTVHRQFRR